MITQEIKDIRENSKDTVKNSKRDLKARAYYFALKIIKLVDTLPQQRSNWVIADQLVRSATSIGANVIEAQAASSKKDFVNFLSHSLKSANETKFWLGLLRDSNKAAKNLVNELLEEVTEFSKILGASILTAKGKRSF
jgi:four helix bundle protein